MPMSDQSRSRAVRHMVVLAALFFLAFTRPAYAYVDPGSLSIVIAATLGAIAAIGYTARLYWERFKSLLVQVKARFKGDKSVQTRK